MTKKNDLYIFSIIILIIAVIFSISNGMLIYKNINEPTIELSKEYREELKVFDGLGGQIHLDEIRRGLDNSYLIGNYFEEYNTNRQKNLAVPELPENVEVHKDDLVKLNEVFKLMRNNDWEYESSFYSKSNDVIKMLWVAKTDQVDGIVSYISATYDLDSKRISNINQNYTSNGVIYDSMRYQEEDLSNKEDNIFELFDEEGN